MLLGWQLPSQGWRRGLGEGLCAGWACLLFQGLFLAEVQPTLAHLSFPASLVPSSFLCHSPIHASLSTHSLIHSLVYDRQRPREGCQPSTPQGITRPPRLLT